MGSFKINNHVILEWTWVWKKCYGYLMFELKNSTCKSVLGSLSFSSSKFWTRRSTWEEFRVIWHPRQVQSESSSRGSFGKILSRHIWHLRALRKDSNSVASEQRSQVQLKYQLSLKVRRLALWSYKLLMAHNAKNRRGPNHRLNTSAEKSQESCHVILITFTSLPTCEEIMHGGII